MNVVYPLLAVIVVSLISVVFAIPFLLKKKVSDRTLLLLLSFSIGSILATVFMGFLPEIFEHGYSFTISFFILGGFLLMFVVERLVHFHHHKRHDRSLGHSHAYSLAPINLIGDGLHNFIDGLVIAGSFAISPVVGVTATVSIILHEIPQEIADFGILLYSGMSKKKALAFNFFSAIAAILGTVVGIFLIGEVHGSSILLIAFAAGNFMYIAAANLIPQLHKHYNWTETVLHVIAIVLGILLISSIALYGPQHSHGEHEDHEHESHNILGESKDHVGGGIDDHEGEKDHVHEGETHDDHSPIT